MGRLGGQRRLKVRISSRLSWTFSAGAELGGRGRRLPPPSACAAGLRASAALVRAALRAGRPRPCPPAARAARRRRPGRR
ncbi:hypothetical protein E4K10_38325 [Streptomyces sp. T1317-0309]|nr:hypothetical protein E4K10_38325 [Streptomyces sp. T1317-0309]